MRILTKQEAHEIATENLRLDCSLLDLTASETIASSIRRAASFLSPCSASRLVQSVVKSQKFLVDDIVKFKEKVSDTLEALIAYGDLVEQSDFISTDEKLRGRVLYLRPPSFLWRGNGSALLIGIGADDASLLPTVFERRIEHWGHIKRIYQKADEDLFKELKKFGLNEILFDSWNLKNEIPSSEIPFAHIEKFKSVLKDNPGFPAGLRILNHEIHDVKHYSRRWELVTNQTGFFVARRSQLYGNDLWCLVELSHGRVVGMTDFPIFNKYLPGKDEAWRLQMAFDAARNEPQVYSILRLSGENSQLKFFSPIPSWAQRRLDNLGLPIDGGDFLFSYKIPNVDLPQETKFLEEKLWLSCSK